jgi:DNA modification methylase
MTSRRSNAPPLVFRECPLQSLKKSGRNVRRHSPTQIAQIAKIINEVGFVNPVLIDETETIICGDARFDAARELGMTAIPAIQVFHLTPVEKRKLAIADNKLPENASWDLESLKRELEFFAQDLEFDFSSIGYETAEVDVILDQSNKALDKDDTLPEAPAGQPPATRAGDTWLLGNSRLICGDALASQDYQAVLGADQARAVITDPPYNVRIDGHAGGRGGVKHREFVMASGEMTTNEFVAFLTAAFYLFARFSLNGSLHYIFMDWRHALETLSAAAAVYFEHKNTCVWAKTNAGMGSFYRSQHELIYVFKNGTAAHINNIELGAHGRYRSNLWSYQGINSFGRDRDALLALHPTVKPVALIADAIKDCSARGDLILDPFAGSGTTLIAAEKAGRRAALIEIDPLYCDTIVRRWQSFTGGHAVCASTGYSFEERQNRSHTLLLPSPKLLPGSASDQGGEA